jgi:hypothetical protein
VRHGGGEQTATEEFMGNNKARTVRVDVRTPIEEFEGNLEAIQDKNGLAKSIQIHHVFWDLPISQRSEPEKLKLDAPYLRLHSF